MFIQTVRIVIPLVLLQFLTGCQSDDNDKLKSEIESLKQEIDWHFTCNLNLLIYSCFK